MAIHNTPADAANTAVRTFLTKVGEKYWGKIFNTGTGSGQITWNIIKDDVFNGTCCYCGRAADKLQIEHLIMFNREEYGLHHPGNIAPCCKDCNKRSKNNERKHVSWDEHLGIICENRNDLDKFDERHSRILDHIGNGKYAYPSFNENEKHAIRVIAESLYENVQTEIKKSLQMYGKLTDAFVVDELDIKAE